MTFGQSPKTQFLFRPFPEIEVERLNANNQIPFQGAIPRQPFIVNFKVLQLQQNGIDNQIIAKPLNNQFNSRLGILIKN